MSNERELGERGSPSAAAAPSYIPTLDGLRGIAVALVMVTHLPSQPAAQINRALPHLMHMGGYLGVDLFFVLSGFLITRILLADSAAGRPLRLFLIRRCLRIFPIYYLVLAVYALFDPSEALLWCAGYLSNYYFAFVPHHGLLGHTWSLAIEEHFYLLWPLVVRRVSRLWSRRILVSLMVLSIASSCALVIAHVPEAAGLIFQGTLSRLWSLALGAVLAFSKYGSLARPMLRHSALPLALGLGLAMVAAALASSNRSAWAYLVMVPGYSLISLAALLAALSAAQGAAPLTRLLTSHSLTFTGRISYGLYLYHPFAYRVFLAPSGETLSLGLLTRAALAILAAFGLAALSFRYIESYFLRLKSRFVVQPSTSA